MGSTITVKKGSSSQLLPGKNSEDQRTAVYTIVGSYEVKPEEGKISDESPLGKAFLSHKAGDYVKVATPAGTSTYEIIKIE